MAYLTNSPRFPLFWRSPKSERPHLIDPVAFFAALILGPIVFTLLTFYLFIPVFALAFGAPTYLPALGLGLMALCICLGGATLALGLGFSNAVATLRSVMVDTKPVAPRAAA